MKVWRLTIPLFLALLVSYNGKWVRFIYSSIGASNFSVLGSLPDFEVPCSRVQALGKFECGKAFTIDHKRLIQQSGSVGAVVGLGVGVLLGGSEWFCTTNQGLTKIHQTGNGSEEVTFRDGLTLYQTGTIPLAICQDDLHIIVAKDRLNSTGNIGWKSGDLVQGSPAVVASYKVLNDFFSSYIRAFLTVITLLFLIVFEGVFTRDSFGTFWYRRAMILFSLHFLSSSSFFSFISPNSFNLGFPLLMAGGSAGCICLVLCLVEISWRRSILSVASKANAAMKIGLPIAAIAFFGSFYQLAGGKVYAQVQLILALFTLPLAVFANAPGLAMFACIFNVDVLANRGILPGLPTNTSVHFLFFNYIYDSFEWVLLNSRMMNQLSHISSKAEIRTVLTRFCDHFRIGRTSASLFTRDYKFRTYQILSEAEAIINEGNRVTHIAASVMTARAPRLRVQVGSLESKLLKGEGQLEDKEKGREYSIFPLIHAEKVLGTLNMTTYSRGILGDPSQMILFLSLIERIIPKLAEAYYRHDLSPTLDEQRIILEHESSFASIMKKDRAIFINSIDRIAKAIDCKIIISRAIPSINRLATFTSHNYLERDAKFLETHSPTLDDILVTSPANVAISRRSLVYINDISRMFAIYPETIVSLLIRNETKSLLVAPVILQARNSRPWGVIWIECSNQLGRPESDLRDLAEFASASIHRQLLSLFECEAQRQFTAELSSLIPAHVVAKIQRGENPREAEEGFLLNIDLSGSTKLINYLGDIEFSNFIQKLSGSLSDVLSSVKFTQQLIIFDAFIFTRATEFGMLELSEVQRILKSIDQVVSEASQILPNPVRVQFRAVLHYGDTTRDLNQGSVRSWTVKGAALAESCKLEANLKDKVRIMLVSIACRAKLLPNSSSSAVKEPLLISISD